MFYHLSKLWTIFLCLMFLSSCSTSSQDSSKKTGKILAVFQATIFNKAGYELFSADLNGDITHLSEGLTNDGSVLDYFIASNANLIAFTVSGEGTTENLYVSDLKTLNRTAVTSFTSTLPKNNSGSIREYILSPKGEQIAYTVFAPDTQRRFALNIYSIEEKTSIEISPELKARDLYWSPDGKYLAFIGHSSTVDTVTGIFVIDLETLDITKITDELGPNEQLYLSNNSWSPQSEQLIFQTNHLGGSSSVSIANVNGRTQTELSMDEFDILDRWIWSPDGTKLAFISDHETPNQLELYTIESDTNYLLKVSQPDLSEEKVYEFDWSPNSKNLAYITGGVASPSLYSVSLVNYGHQKISDYLPVSQQSSAWSPGSDKLAYGIYDPDINSKLFIYDEVSNESTNVIRSDQSSYALRTRPVWSKTANYLAFEAATELISDIYISKADGTITNIISAEAIGQFSIGRPQWANDDENLVFMSSEISSGTVDLYRTVREKDITSCITCSLEQLYRVNDFELVNIF